MGIALVPAFLGDAKSDTLSGNTGRAYAPADAGCFFQSSWNGISSNCSGIRGWLMPIQNRWGTSTKTFTAFSNSSPLTGLSCEAFIANQSAGLIWKSGAKNVATAGTTLGSFSSTANDSLHVVCNFDGNLPTELRVVRVTG